MRPAPWLAVEPGRLQGEYGEPCGLFQVPHAPTGVDLRIIASSDGGWEHVSVSLPRRCPNWPEMAFVKGLFWRPDEAVVQFHPAADQYINEHPFCLHLWRPTTVAIPLPPRWMVGRYPGWEADAKRDLATWEAA